MASSKSKESQKGAGDNADQGGEWTMVRQLRSDDPVYRKFSSIAAPNVVERTRRGKFGEEIMSVAWSPDSNILAWSVGSNLVSLHSVAQLLPQSQSEDLDLGGLISADDKEKGGRMAELDCGAPVTCMYFGSRVSDKKWHAGEVSYNRFEEQVKNQLLLATGLANGDVKIWEVATGKLLMVLKDHSDQVTDLQFSPDGSLVLLTASKDCTVKLWDLMDDGNMFRTLERDDAFAKKAIKKVSWSPDATQIATVGDGKLAVIYDMKTFKVAQRLQGHQNDVTGCRFSADGAFLYTSSFDTRVVCWNVKDGSRVRSYEHMSPPPSAIFAAGTNEHEVLEMDLRKNFLATISNDLQMRVWNVSSKDDQPVTVQDVVPDARSLAFSDDARTLAIGCQGGLLQFYQVR